MTLSEGMSELASTLQLDAGATIRVDIAGDVARHTLLGLRERLLDLNRARRRGARAARGGGW